MRRRSVSLSAGPTGFNPLALYCAAMNASMGLVDGVRPRGVSGRSSFRRTQRRASAEADRGVVAAALSAGGAAFAAGAGVLGFFFGGAAKSRAAAGRIERHRDHRTPKRTH